MMIGGSISESTMRPDPKPACVEEREVVARDGQRGEAEARADLPPRFGVSEAARAPPEKIGVFRSCVFQSSALEMDPQTPNAS